MANYIVQDTSLAAVADAIRSKTGGGEALAFPAGFVSAVEGITGGGSDVAAPFCEVSVSMPHGAEYYYNTGLMPEIPADIIEGHKHVLITKTPSSTRIYADTNKPYYSTAESGYGRIIIPNGAYLRATLNTAANAWVKDYSAESSWLGVDGAEENFAVWWSNYDVPKGSQDATEVYFPACEPKTEKPADATHFYYNGTVLPKIPESVFGGYSYLFIFWESYTDCVWLYGSTGQPYLSGSAFHFSSGGRRCKYNSEADAWEIASVQTPDNYFIFNNYKFLWTSGDIKDRSGYTETIYRRGTVPVPVPTE